jgi:hypothetical protein
MRPWVLILTAAASAVGPASSQATTPASAVDWPAVDRAMGRAGAMMPGEVYRFGMPRSDLSVTSQGVAIRPALSLGSWLAMKQTGPNQVVAMGDLVLREDEVNPVLSRLQEAGIGQTAIHKHLPEHSPSVWWVHVHAHGDPVGIAQGVHAALVLTGTPTMAPAATDTFLLDSALIHRALGQGGRVSGGVYQVSVPRRDTIHAMGIVVPPSMGVATAINFQPAGEGRAATNGDFVLLGTEVDAVIRTLRGNGFRVVEVHNHLTDEAPRLFFLHFWAVDTPAKLASGLRAALEQTNSMPGSH